VTILSFIHIMELPLGNPDSRLIRTTSPPVQSEFPSYCCILHYPKQHCFLEDSKDSLACISDKGHAILRWMSVCSTNRRKATYSSNKNAANAALNISDLTVTGHRSNQSLCGERKAAMERTLKTDMQLCVCVCLRVCVHCVSVRACARARARVCVKVGRW
jgi:hypothetical protein